MKKVKLTTLVVMMTILSSCSADSMIDLKSSYGVQETGDRLERVLDEKGMTLFNRIKHSEAAENVGVDFLDTELINFGNPEVGSPLMKCQQRVAIDLPQKALIWSDSAGDTWISYNNPRYLEKRHDISNCEDVISTIETALAGIAEAAATD